MFSLTAMNSEMIKYSYFCTNWVQITDKIRYSKQVPTTISINQGIFRFPFNFSIVTNVSYVSTSPLHLFEL